MVGEEDGRKEGIALGVPGGFVGRVVGLIVGIMEGGLVLGNSVGAIVGTSVNWEDGAKVGESVGILMFVGELVGFVVGRFSNRMLALSSEVKYIAPLTESANTRPGEGMEVLALKNPCSLQPQITVSVRQQLLDSRSVIELFNCKL